MDDPTTDVEIERATIRSRATKAFTYAIFFASGAAALTYEISWSRQIGLLLGNTASAAATVLASYFVGLALGYALAGRLAARAARPLLAYGVLELTAAAWALIVPSLLKLFHAGGAASLFGGNDSLAQTALRAVVCILIFLPATTALGGTLPLMARWVETDARSASRIAWAYGLNTFGGLVGVLLATIFLLAFVGVAGSSYVAASVSAACGLAAIVMARFTAARGARRHVETVPLPSINNVANGTSTQGVYARRSPLFLVAMLVAISGFTTLALEVLYTRLFALIFHNSTYTFGLVIAVVLFGLAVGAWLAAWLERTWEARRVAAWALLLAAAAISFSTLLFLNRTGLRYFHGGETFAIYMLASFGLVALIAFPPSLLLGMVLPLLWNVAESRRDRPVRPSNSSPEDRTSLAETVGQLTAINTLSAAVGALAASFVLLPTFGLWASFSALAVLCIVGSLLLLNSKPSLLYGATLLATGCLALAAWRVTTLQQAIPAGKTLIQRTEGAYGWIDVLRDDRTGVLSLRENVNYTHGSTASSTWERRQSHIPLLLHPAPRDVLYLGSGTGATAGGATMHDDIKSIHIAELIPEVIDASRLFDESNLGVFDDPHTTVHIDDARHYLLTTDQRFDVIVSDLFVPWESKTGYLYTVDHYRIARARLKPGGVFCQWLAMWQLGEGEFEMIVDSFAAVFPNTTLWWGKIEYDRSIIGLIGSDEPIVVDAADVQSRMDRIFADPPMRDRRLDDANELARRFIGRWPVRDDVLLNTDERPRLEFAMPLTYADNATLKRRAMQDYAFTVLSHLPQIGVEFVNFPFIDGTSPKARRDWQALQLRK